MHSSHNKPPLKPPKKSWMAKSKEYYEKSKIKLGLKKAPVDIVQVIPNKAIELWVENRWNELNRYAKLSSTPHLLVGAGHDRWQDRIATDILRCRTLEIIGDWEQSWNFPDFETLEEKETLLCTVRNYLHTCVEELIKTKHETLDNDSLKELAEKAVDQVLISLCQEFINQPYFTHLKQVANEYSLEPVACDIAPKSAWKVATQIEFKGNRIKTIVCRTFKTYRNEDMEMQQTSVAFGFRRTFVIDCLGGPPKIVPPVWLGLKDGKAFEFQCTAKVKRRKSSTLV